MHPSSATLVKTTKHTCTKHTCREKTKERKKKNLKFHFIFHSHLLPHSRRCCCCGKRSLGPHYVVNFSQRGGNHSVLHTGMEVICSYPENPGNLDFSRFFFFFFFFKYVISAELMHRFLQVAILCSKVMHPQLFKIHVENMPN